jgi:hypothetical protein
VGDGERLYMYAQRWAWLSSKEGEGSGERDLCGHVGSGLGLRFFTHLSDHMLDHFLIYALEVLGSPLAYFRHSGQQLSCMSFLLFLIDC